MNENIENLKKQCYISIVDRDGDMEYNMQKFAELIVKECYQICKDNLIAGDDYGELNYNDGVMDCGIMIMHHFGVK